MALEQHVLDLRNRATFKLWVSMNLRFSDQDPMGHVNNAVYAQWIEAPRVLLLEPFVNGTPNLNTVLAKITIDYLQETSFPGDVEIGACLTALGRRSLKSAYGVFRDDVCLATAECVNVFFDTDSRKSTDPPDEVRAAIKQAMTGD